LRSFYLDSIIKKNIKKSITVFKNLSFLSLELASMYAASARRLFNILEMPPLGREVRREGGTDL
jgi:hypothetical protein